MKPVILSLLLAVTASAATGDFIFTKAGPPNVPVLLTPVNGRVLYWNGTTLGNYDIATALGLKAPTASPTFTGTLNAATIAASGTVTGSNLSGTNTGDNATNSLYSGLAASKADDSAVVKLAGTQTITGAKTVTGVDAAITIGSDASLVVGTNGTVSVEDLGLVVVKQGGSFSYIGTAANDHLQALGGAVAPTGTGAIVRATSPTLVTPTLGAANATSIGAGTPGTGAFTTLSASGAITATSGVSLPGGGTVTGTSGAITITPTSGSNLTLGTASTGKLVFGTDNATDIGSNGGASGNRPKSIYAASAIFSGSQIIAGTYLSAADSSFIGFTSSRSIFKSSADGVFQLYNNAATSGISLDFATDGTLKVRNKTNTASTGNLDIGGTLAVTSSSTLTGGLILPTSTTPASASAAGVAGTVCRDADYIYVCTATNTWKRVAISTW